MKPTYEELEREISAYEATVANLEQRVTELAAENVALKAFGDKLSEMHNALNGEGTGIQGRAEVACQQAALEAAMEEFDDIKTHATDRIVAGIKADGVDEFAAHLVSMECHLEAEWEKSFVLEVLNVKGR